MRYDVRQGESVTAGTADYGLNSEISGMYDRMCSVFIYLCIYLTHLEQHMVTITVDKPKQSETCG